MRLSILITGASGFIGSHIVEEALSRKYDVWAGVRPTTNKQYLTNRKIHFIDLDYTNVDDLRSKLSGHKGTHSKWDVVVHCAGVTKTKNKAEFETGNYETTKHLIECLDEFNMRPKQFIFISTLGAYGPTQEKSFEPIKESDNPQPNTAYGASKLKTEQYLKSIPNFPYVIIRPTGVFGPRERDYFLMAKSIKNHVDFSVALRRQDLTFVYIKDLTQAIFRAIDKEITRKSYFVSDGRVYASSHFSKLIRKEMGAKFVIPVKVPLFILKGVSLCAESFAGLFNKASTLNSDKYRIMKQKNWQCDIAPLIQDLDFQPQYSLEEGVKETIAWYKEKGWL